MQFEVYDPERTSFDTHTQETLKELRLLTSTEIQFRELPDATMCLRSRIPQKGGRGESLPLAAIDDTVYEAAQRLLAMIQQT